MHAAALLFAGCAATTPAAPQANPPASATNSPPIQPLGLLWGVVASANQRLRFVILDFRLGGTPSPGRVLDVLRSNTVVGRVLISGPQQDGWVTAEILQGEPMPGDETRGH